MLVARRNTFETNSSSTHSLIMCSGDEYEQLKNGDALIKDHSSVVNRSNKLDEIIDNKYTLEEYLNYCKEYNLNAEDVNTIFDNIDDLNEEEIIETSDLCTLDTFLDNEYLEDFRKSYTTKNGEKIIAFGLYGYKIEAILASFLLYFIL